MDDHDRGPGREIAQLQAELDDDGRERWRQVTAVPFRSEEGAVAGAVVVAENIAERTQADEAMGRERSLLESVMRTTDVMLVLLDPQFNFVWVNDAYARTCRMEPAEMVGKNHFALYPDPENEAIFRQVRDTGEGVFFKDKPFLFPDQPERGATYWDWSLAPTKDVQGHVTGLVFSLRETTQHKRAELALAEQRELLSMAMQTTRTGWGMSDWRTGEAEWSESGRRLMGLETDEDARTIEGWLRRVHPEDRPRVEAHARQAAAEHKDIHIEFRVSLPDGATRWVLGSGKILYDEKDHPVRSTGFVTDITERKRSEQELREARAAAEEASRAKDEFVAMVSHELRNPLSAIMAGISVLRASCPGDGSAGRALEIVARSAALQARLVNDLLDLSRLQRGKLQLQRAPFALQAVVTAACQSYQAEAAEAGLSLTCRCDPDLWVHGDFDRLQQVVMNLLSNAMKFTPAGGKVSLTAATGDGGRETGEGHGAAGCRVSALPSPVARLVVADTGIGLDRAMLDGLFEMFEQGEIAGKHRAGLGLGLALARGIVERHGGRLWAESEGVGKGSSFVVELPAVAAPAMRPPAAARACAERRAIRVLWVEDNDDTRTLVADALALAGHEVQAAGSGEEALDLLGEAHPDVLLVDIGLPGMDGCEFLRRARELPGIAAIPAFAVTGCGAEEDVRRGREAGFTGHFVKPVSVENLLARVVEWVHGKRS